MVLEDLGLEHKVLGHHLKLWADRYPFIGETKGGAIAPHYSKFVVTSQYKIEDIWEDPPTIEALSRRFEVKEIPKAWQTTLEGVFPEGVIPADLQGP